MPEISRRRFVQQSAVVAGVVQLAANAARGNVDEPTKSVDKPVTSDPAAAGRDAAVHWLDGPPPSGASTGVTFGVPWARGAIQPGQAFSLKSQAGEAVALQSWPIAFWPDGSLKWSAHAAGPDITKAQQWTVAPADAPATAAAPAKPVVVREAEDAIEIDTGVIRCRVLRRGAALIESIRRDDRPIAADVRLVCLLQDSPGDAETGSVRREAFAGAVDTVVVEQTGPVRAVVRIDGKHVGQTGRKWLPFTLRLYFYAGGESVRLVHSFVFDGDENKDFLAGLGVRFAVPMRDRMQDRHVRFVGADGGVWAEAVRTLTGLRRDAGETARKAQIDGKPTPAESDLPQWLRGRMEMIPAWGDFTLAQRSADGFSIRKRSKSGHGWIPADSGTRAAGTGYVGGTSGGVAFGLRDFWQRHPTQLDVRGAATDRADVTMWMYSPDAPAMDLRFYHDGLGLDTYAKQLEALEVTYEDYEPGFGTAHGIARTSEMMLWALPTTPARDVLVGMAKAVQAPSLLVCGPERYHGAGVFGIWSLPDRSNPAKARIEKELDFLFDFYAKQREQRRWYGFWDYGDVMHTYDADRHVWRYDVGGYAWDNSELSPDLWLWYSFLRTGRADVFRFAEAMTRHTGEVDVYHAGRFAGLGTRHNVQHWGCSAKQLRISSVVYRRIFYFVSGGDERTGDLMRELLNADRQFTALDPLRKVRTEPYTPAPRALSIQFGLDWGSLAAAWLAEWERSGNTKIRDKLLAGMRSLGAMRHGLFTAGATYDPETGVFTDPGAGKVDVSHLTTLFGLPELAPELIQLFGDEASAFERVWLEYCDLYNAGNDAQAAALGKGFGRLSQVGPHSRLTAYAAWRKRDANLAARAAREFTGERSWPRGWYSGKTYRVEGPHVLNAVDEAPWITTNETSQWALAAIANLALIPEALTDAP